MGNMVNEQLLDERLAALEKARGWSPRLISKLESHIRAADDQALFRINPFTFARERNLQETEVIDLLLHATSLGLFSMDWALFCPQCCCVVESLRSLKQVHNHYHCAFCQVGYDAALDEYIAVSFTVSPDVRELDVHHPERLPAWDNFFRTGNTSDGVLPDGTPLVVAKQGFAKIISYLPAGETTALELEINEGTIIASSPDGKAAALVPVSGAPATSPTVIPVPYGNDMRSFPVIPGPPGKFVFTLDNQTAQRGMFVIAVVPPGFDMSSIKVSFVPFLNGKRLLTTQAFRDLFRSEVIKASEGIGVKNITLLFTDLKGSTALYDQIGDLNAFSLVQQHFDRLQEVTIRNKGAIIKTIGDAVMAAFLEPADAVAAALAMRTEIAAFNAGQRNRVLILKIGIHTGAAIAVTLNERLDYFGQTVNIAARVQNLADADEIYISDDVHAAKGVQTLLGALPVESKVSKLRGVQADLRVFCIAGEPMRVAAAN
jgi:class 3 adenylate cyclase